MALFARHLARTAGALHDPPLPPLAIVSSDCPMRLPRAMWLLRARAWQRARCVGLRPPAHYPAVGAKIADGDLMVVTVDEQESVGGGGYLVASFHGDTDGLASSPTLAAVHAYHTASAPQRKLIFGLDANTYSKPKPGKQAGAAEFIADAVSKGYAASGGEASGKDATTFTARTYLQPQLQKACKAAAKAATGDKNPKDFILYGAESGLAVTEYGIDNTARKAYVEDLVLPTLGWPSDHALVYTTFSIDPAAAGSRV